MILWIGIITLIIGQLIEKKTSCISNVLKTEKGQCFFGNNLAIFLTGAVELIIASLMMVLLKIDQNFLVPLVGMILGEMMIVITVTYDFTHR